MKNYIKYHLKKILKKDNQNWCLGHFKTNKNIFKSKQNILEAIDKITLLKPPTDEFWADPFIYNHKNKTYVFFEKFYKKENKGVISVGKLRNGKLVDIRDILTKNYHLSYPFVYKVGKNIFLIPESHTNKKIQIYKSTQFPFNWKKIKTIFNDQITCDPTIFKHKGSNWMFINKTKKNLKILNKNLYLYKIIGDFKKIIPHKKNPILSNFKGGRSAGKILNINKKLIRPAQINKQNFYGYGLIFYEIKKLDINNYIEKEIFTISLKDLKNCSGVHHISKQDGQYLIDLNIK